MKLQAPGGPRRMILIWMLLASPVLTVASAAQQPGGAGAPSSPPGAAGAEVAEGEPGFPDISQVVPRVLALADEAAAAEEELQSLGEVADLQRQVVVGEGLEVLAAAVQALPQHRMPDWDRVTGLRARAERERERLDDLLEIASGRYRRLQEIRRRWEGEAAFFRAWRRALAQAPGAGATAGELEEAQRLARGVVAGVDAAVPPVVEVQQQVQQQLQRDREVLGVTARLLEDWQERLRRRGEPILFTQAFFAQWRPEMGTELRRGFVAALALDRQLFERSAEVLALHLALFLVVALAARRLRGVVAADDRWRPLLNHPWALGLFTSVLALGPLYEPMPEAWRMGLSVALASSGCLVAAATFHRRRRRWALYLLAALYLAFELSEAVALPAPVYRLVLVLLCLGSLPWLLLLARREARDGGRTFSMALLLRLGAAALLTIAVLEGVGYHALSRWLFESVLGTTFVFFVATYVIRLARRLLRLLVRTRLGERFGFLRQVGGELAGRVSWLLQVVVAGVAVLYVADLWTLAESPWSAWRAVVGFELAMGPVVITVGQILLGAAAVYVAFLASWLIRAMLDEQIVSRGVLDVGVGNSVKLLLHYSLILVGVVLALSALGIPLQSFAIVAGALGVGIGFGLQNVVSNFASGLILLFERPVRVGDTVVVGGEWGVIRRIGLRSTVVQTYDRSEVIVPNSELVSERVTNWTLSNRVARVVFGVGVAYGSDLERVLAILEAVAAEHPEVLEDPAPLITLAGFGDSSVDFEVRAWLRDIDHRLRTQSDLLKEVARRFAEAGITIPFPQRDLHLHNVETVDRGGPA